MSGPMNNTNCSNARRAFTLIELLLAMGIIAILAAILLPTLAAVRITARIAATRSLISRLDLAILNYQRDFTTFPPDGIAVSTPLWSLGPPPISTSWTPKDTTGNPTAACPPEALYYFLAHPFLSGNHPYITLAKRSEWTDCNANGLPEVVDSWSRPIVYSRDPCPNAIWNFPYQPPNGRHKAGSYDLFSVGPDGLAGINTSPPLGHTTPIAPYNKDGSASPWDTGSLAEFCHWTIVEDSAGQSDDISNWVH